MTTKNIPVNPRLSLSRCWDMVNRIQGDTPDETIERFHIAEKWLRANEVVSNDEFDDLMMAATFLLREAYQEKQFPGSCYC